jgi:hypothetical protein
MGMMVLTTFCMSRGTGTPVSINAFSLSHYPAVRVNAVGKGTEQGMGTRMNPVKDTRR